VARGVGCVDVQVLELNQHFVAVVVGHEVTEGVDVALQRVMEPVGGCALDVDLGAGRPSALVLCPIILRYVKTEWKFPFFSVDKIWKYTFV